MTLNQLIYFIEVCESSSLTSAAQKLHISQPSLSVAIRELEKEFGVNLLIRHKKQLLLSEEGRFFLEKAKSLVVQAGLLQQQMVALGEKSKVLRVGAPPLAATFVFPKLVMEFNSKYPDVQIELVETGTHELEQLLADNFIDAALTNLDSHADLYNYIPITSCEVIGCVRADHPLAWKKNIAMTRLQNEKLVALMPTSRIVRNIKSAFEKENAVPHFYLYSRQIFLILKFVQDYNMVTFMISQLPQHDGALAPFYLKNPIIFNYALICRKDRPMSREISKLIKFCESELLF